MFDTDVICWNVLIVLTLTPDAWPSLFYCIVEIINVSTIEKLADDIQLNIGSDEELSGDENELMVRHGLTKSCGKFVL